ncbi:hypothetical protein [Cytophaga aurantiaca]|uniref:hypothetical protein n=1 Tax=Cytophaga aurantiaca TaxID=29530 RepID=UPI000360490F|nr:hypothetical protein [Cytophaga aurantiaca]
MEKNKEQEFIDKIDCRFPYQNRKKCFDLINEAIALSPNAVFSVIEEICRIPSDERNSTSTFFLIELLTDIRNKFDHPLKEMILSVAQKMVQEEDIDVDDAISKMLVIKNYTGQYAALSILYCSCDDIHGKLEPVWKSIRHHWHNS